MDDITLQQESVMIKEEVSDTFQNEEQDMLGNNSDEVNAPVAVFLQPKVEMEEAEEQAVKTEHSSSEPKQNDAEEEELKPLAAVYIKTEVETDEETEEQDHLPDYPPTGCEEWDGKHPSDSLHLREKKEETTGAEMSYERSEQEAIEEVKDCAEDASGSNKLFPTDDREDSRPENEDVSTHTNRQPFPCVYCSGTVRYNKTLEEHAREHPEEPKLLTCDTCQRQFTARIALERHSRAQVHEAEKKSEFSCDTCAKEFKHGYLLKRHMRVHTGEKPYVCDHCGKEFTRAFDLNVHRRKHTGEQEMSECEVCDYRCETRYMIRHMRTHTGEKPYQCRFCEATFALSGSRLRHEEMHSDRKEVHCKVCGKSFLSTRCLKSHMTCHSGEKPYKCGYCEKTFARSTHRTRHEVTHTKQYPHNCAECGRGFYDKVLLAKHTLTHGNGNPDVKRKRRV